MCFICANKWLLVDVIFLSEVISTQDNGNFYIYMPGCSHNVTNAVTSPQMQGTCIVIHFLHNAMMMQKSMEAQELTSWCYRLEGL